MNVSDSTMNFLPEDMTVLNTKGITPEVAMAQLERFKTGFPFLKLESSAVKGHGITVMTPAEETEALDRWERYLSDGGWAAKFVPASGAASRMFKELFGFVEGVADIPAEGSAVDEIIKHADHLPFKDELDEICVKLYGVDGKTLIADKRYKDFIGAIILPNGLNYGALPKALLTFHNYGTPGVRTPLEEQLAEGAQTVVDNKGVVNLHFTVSADHRKLFEKKLEEVVPEMERKLGVKYNISLSEQKPSTDTIAGDALNVGQPFRDKNGKLVFRPGGHGALIENLNDMEAPVVFVKNIDNVVPERLRESTIKYKKVLGGKLMLVHDRLEDYLRVLRSKKYDRATLEEMLEFAENTLCIYNIDKSGTEDELAKRLTKLFDRPLRVCGMVKNDGEPGGGPYIAYNADNTASPQILESTQIDKHNTEAMEMMSKATHFNPVDLVCYLTDIEGKHYDLPCFTDPSTGFISSKSYQGRELLALELPGLWNGAMSKWNTIFVEVPADTFNPVKTVNDLLRPAHKA